MFALLAAAAFFIGCAITGHPGDNALFWALLGLGLLALHFVADGIVTGWIARRQGTGP